MRRMPSDNGNYRATSYRLQRDSGLAHKLNPRLGSIKVMEGLPTIGELSEKSHFYEQGVSRPREFPSLMVGDVACVIYCVRDVDDEVFDQSRILRDTPRNIGVGAAACLDGSLETRGSVGNG